ncbi:AAA family ATPase, partial [Rhizobium ruizarguesonis]
LDPEQVDAVRHVTRDNGIAAVVGLAGAGKSTLLAAARVAWEHDGRRVIGASLSGKAAEGLEDSSGIRSRTLASWELAWARGRELLERGNVLVIDEAGMVSSQQLA